MSIYDVDAEAAKFQPVRVKFRGTEYTLGGDVCSLLSAASLFGNLPDGEDSLALSRAVFEYLRPVVRVLSPAIGEVMDREDLNAGEEAALLRPVTEVLSRIGDLSFPAEGQE